MLGHPQEINPDSMGWKSFFSSKNMGKNTKKNPVFFCGSSRASGKFFGQA
jgi:hypothetical protein